MKITEKQKHTFLYECSKHVGEKKNRKDIHIFLIWGREVSWKDIKDSFHFIGIALTFISKMN